MVDEVISKELLEDVEFPTALHFSVFLRTTAFAASVNILLLT